MNQILYLHFYHRLTGRSHRSNESNYLHLDMIREWLGLPRIDTIWIEDDSLPWWHRNVEVYMLARMFGISSLECMNLMDRELTYEKFEKTPCSNRP